MKNGNKKLATKLITTTFENVKRLQLERYHKATTSEAKAEIELDPFVIFHRAVDNCTPILQLKGHRKGGITYQVSLNINLSHIAMVKKNIFRQGKGTIFLGSCPNFTFVCTTQGHVVVN